MAPKLIPLVAQFACWCGAMIVATGLLAHAVGSLSHSQSPSLSIPAAIQQEGLRPLNIELFHALDAISIPRLIPGVPDKAIYGLRSYYQVNDTSYLVPHLLDLATAQSVQLLPAEECKDINMIFPIDNSHYGYTINSTLHIRGLPLASNSGAGTHFNYTWPVDVWGFSYNADTKRLFFLSSVYPNMTLEQTTEHDEYLSKHKFDSARIYDNLWIRHWNRWMIPKKTNIFVTSMVQDSNGNWTIGEPRNLMAGLPHFTSDPNLQPDSNTYTVSPKGDKLAFTLRPQREGFVWSTDVDIYIVDTDPNRGPEQPVLITGAYDGTASNPAFSGDGTKLAWLQMETPKYEADINRIHVFDVMEGRELPLSLARDWDQSPSDLTWSWDDRVLYATVDIKGSTQIFAIDIAEGRRTDITSEYGYGIVEVPQPISASELLVYAGDLDKPGNAFVIPSTYSRGGGGGSGPPPTPRQLTDVNGDKLRGVYLDKAHDFWFKGARGDLVHGWYLLPYGFDAAKKWPLAMIVHGGPQQNNDKAFSYAQWNENMYANAGFFTVLINFHGSPSYGQDFTNSINNQWGGYPYEDLILGLDYLLDQFDFIDSNRMVSLGASYGGYMQNWLNGHTDRFQCLVNHDGEFDLTSSYYSTDELWFPEYDLDGVPFRGAESLKPLYRERYSDGYKRWSPSEYADQMKTPTLFIHGQNDFRLSLSQSIMPFTLLRRKGIQARLMYFPDEDHWTNRKANSIRWFTEVMRWISGCTNTSLPYELPQLL